MMKSMTGFGRCQRTVDGRDITVEVKAVNHRYFEFSARLPRSLGYMEDKLKALVQSRVARGKTELSLTVVNQKGVPAVVRINEELAASYVEELRAFGERHGLPDDLSLSALMRLGEIFAVSSVREDEEQLWQQVAETAAGALDAFVEMRTREGDRLAADLEQKLQTILELVSRVEAKSPETVRAYRERLYNKLCEVLSDTKVDESRILTEAAIFADRVAVDEETVRLRSHVDQFRDTLRLREPVGRKLDFLVQEMNREVNTIGSKAQDMEVARMVVDLKSELEKIREQIQNIE
ncbi:MAG: YicC family protein [Clostridiales bacterium]|nr:YicC family protein [Clostridiales bacterium]